MKGMIQDLVNVNQMTFIARRRIWDNILLAQEIFRNVHRNSGTHRCEYKVDTMKGYDHVTWDLLLLLIDLIGFPPNFVRLIEERVSKAKFFIKINGKLCGFREKEGFERAPTSFLWVLITLFPYIVISLKIINCAIHNALWEIPLSV